MCECVGIKTAAIGTYVHAYSYIYYLDVFYFSSSTTSRSLTEAGLFAVSSGPCIHVTIYLYTQHTLAIRVAQTILQILYARTDAYIPVETRALAVAQNAYTHI